MFQETSQAVFNVASLLSTLQSSVSASDVLTLIGSCVGAGMAFVLAWFGGRKVVRSFSSALKKGKIIV